MRRGFLLLGLPGLAAALWFLLGDGEERSSAVDAPPGTHAEEGPALRGADPAARAAWEERLRDQREARQDALRGLEPTSRIDRTIEKTQFRVTGRVVAADGKSAIDAEVAVRAHDGGSGVYAEDDGRFTVEGDFDVPYQVVCHAPGYVPLVLPLRHYKEQEHVDVGTVTLQPGLRLAGRVVDQEGKPWKASLHLTPDDDPVADWWHTAVASDVNFSFDRNTDAEGHFAWDSLPEGRYRIRVNTRGASGSDVVFEQVTAGGEDLEVVIPREPPVDHGAPWHVELVLEPDRPFELTASNAVAHWGGERHHVEARFVDGAIHIKVVGAGPLHALVSAPALAFRPAFVPDIHKPGGQIRVPLRTGLSVEGRVTGIPERTIHGRFLSAWGWLLPDGSIASEQPANGASRRWQHKRLQVDREGRFILNHLPPGEMLVQLLSSKCRLKDAPVRFRTDVGNLQLKGLAYRPLEARFDLPAGRGDASISWVLHRVGAGGEAYVRGGTAISETDVPAAKARTIRDSLYLAEGAGKHVLYARSRGRPVLGPVRVEIPRGAREVRVVFPAPRYLTGTVVDRHGKGLAEAWVELVSAGSPRARTPLVHRQARKGLPSWDGVLPPPSSGTSLDGSFRIALPHEGLWRVVVTERTHRMVGTPPSAAPGVPLKILMEPSRRISGRLSGDPEANYGSYVVTAWPGGDELAIQTHADDEGYFVIESLGDGAHTLTVHVRGDVLGERGPFAGYARLERVRAGARGVKLALVAGASAGLVLRNEAGTVLKDADVRLRSPFRSERVWWSPADEAYVAAGLAPGVHRFDIDLGSGRKQSTEVRAGETGVVVIR